MLNKLEARGDIHGIKVCRGAPLLTHILYVRECNSDQIIFFYQKLEERYLLNMLLNRFQHIV